MNRSIFNLILQFSVEGPELSLSINKSFVYLDGVFVRRSQQTQRSLRVYADRSRSTPQVDLYMLKVFCRAGRGGDDITD